MFLHRARLTNHLWMMLMVAEVVLIAVVNARIIVVENVRELVRLRVWRMLRISPLIVIILVKESVIRVVRVHVRIQVNDN